MISGKTVEIGHLKGIVKISEGDTEVGHLVGIVQSQTFQISANVYFRGGIDAEPYEGEYIIKPTVDDQMLETKNKLMEDDVTVLAIPYFETSNIANGLTVYIGE